MVSLIACADAAGAERLTWIDGVKAAGTPAKYNKVGILKIGPARARNVLVLNPGTSASAAYFAPLARSIVERAPGWQVWAVERRENLLEDHSVLDRAKAGTATPQALFDYYLGWVKDPSITTHVQLIPDTQVTYGSDYPYVPMDTQIQALQQLGLSGSQVSAIESGNAERLLPRLKA